MAPPGGAVTDALAREHAGRRFAAGAVLAPRDSASAVPRRKSPARLRQLSTGPDGGVSTDRRHTHEARRWRPASCRRSRFLRQPDADLRRRAGNPFPDRDACPRRRSP